MATYTMVGTSLFQWSEWRPLSSEARVVWLGIYAGADTKRIASSILLGDEATIAGSISMTFRDTHAGLSELVERGLAEHDPHHRIIRLTKLPDQGDRPKNGNTLIRWWKGFEVLPHCAIRTRHVALIRWLTEPFTENHEKAWKTTFGTLETAASPAGLHGPTPDRTVPESVSQNRSSGSVSQNRLNQLELLPNQGGTERFPEPYVLRSTSHVQTFYGSEGSGEGRSLAPPRSGDFGFAEGSQVGRPPIAAPPVQGAMTGGAMVAALAQAAGGRFSSIVDDRLFPALDAVASQCLAKGVVLADLTTAGEFLRAGGWAHRDDLGASWASRPGAILDLVSNARSWRKGDLAISRAGARAAEDRDEREPAPPERFTTGQRAL